MGPDPKACPVYSEKLCLFRSRLILSKARACTCWKHVFDMGSVQGQRAALGALAF